MSPRKKSIFNDSAVVVALIGLVGTVVTVILAPIIVGALKPATATPVAPPVALNSEEYALQLLADAKYWKLVTLDPFERNELKWLEGNSITEHVEAEHKIESGQYFWHIKGLTESPLRWAVPSKLDPVQDFYTSVMVTRANNLADQRAGIVFRYQGGRLFYDFMIYMDGRFGVRYFDENDVTDKATATLANMPSTLVNPAVANKLAVIGIGNDYWFYINDRFAHYINNPQLSGGTIGLIAGVKEIGQEALITFDDFELRLAP